MRKLLILLAMVLIPANAQADWREAKTPHFLIYSQGSEKSLRQRAERLEAFHNLLLASYGIKTEPRPYRVRIFVVDTTGELQRYLDHPDSMVAGFYRPELEGPVVFTPEYAGESGVFSSQLVLFHEYSYHFMLQNFPVAYPPWYVKGHAELVATASFERSGIITFGKVADHRSDEIFDLHRTASEMLLKAPYGKGGIGLSYGWSWMLTHYLTFAKERKGQLAAYLGALNNGATPAEAAKVFGDLGKLDRDLNKYAEAAIFPYVAVPIPATVATDISIRTLAPDEAAMMPLEMEYTKSMDAAAAKAFAARVKAATAAYPDSAAALKILAKATSRAEDYETAERAADRLVAIAPGDARAHVVRGDVLLARAKAAKGAMDTSLADEARKEMIAANKLDADDPLPLYGYYRAVAARAEGMPRTAVQGLARAMEIVPQDDTMRIDYARALILTGDKAGAEATLKPLAYSPHQNGSAKMAAAMLARLEGREPGDPLKVEPPKDDDGKKKAG